MCHRVNDLINLFKVINLVAPKYMGLESYVVYRLYQLVVSPSQFHPYKVPEANLRKFSDVYTFEHKYCDTDNCLPSDSEIIAAVFTGFLDINLSHVASIKHYFDYTCATKLKLLINDKSMNKMKLTNFIGMINTIPVAAASNQLQMIPHFEAIWGNQAIKIRSGPSNIFYCIMMNLALIYKQFKQVQSNAPAHMAARDPRMPPFAHLLRPPSLQRHVSFGGDGRDSGDYGFGGESSLSVKFGKYDWAEAVQFVFKEAL